MKNVNFEYGTAQLKDIRVTPRVEDGRNTGKIDVTLHDEPVKDSKRFWNSLQIRFGFTHNIFRYFNYDEVFQRISERSGNDTISYCLERQEKKQLPTLLAVRNPKSPAIQHDDMQHLLQKYPHDEVTYSNGVIRSTHTPRYGAPFAIAGDDFRSKFVIDTPIDGYGRPSIYLSLLRMICSNGAIAYTPAFRSEINVGKKSDGATFAIARALEGFNNQEGFAALRQRFESATKSWASVNEVQRAYKVLRGLFTGKRFRNNEPESASEPNQIRDLDNYQLIQSFNRMSGNLVHRYGLANMDSLSAKRQRTLPAGCKVYELLNFMSELATHHADEVGARTIQGEIGTMISSEYDLEGTANMFQDWQDFFIGNRKTIDTVQEQTNR
ncbi:MAG: hypothetical protein R3B84_05000 [Zavarzinella sp.]